MPAAGPRVYFIVSVAGGPLGIAPLVRRAVSSCDRRDQKIQDRTLVLSSGRMQASHTGSEGRDAFTALGCGARTRGPLRGSTGMHPWTPPNYAERPAFLVRHPRMPDQEARRGVLESAGAGS